MAKGDRSATETVSVERFDFGLRYVDNQLIRAAFSLEELGSADLSNTDLAGKVVCRIGNFRVRKPVRNLRLYPPTVPSPHEEDWNRGPWHNQPGPTQTSQGRRTRWDIDLSNLLHPVGGRRRRMEIFIVLDHGLKFWEPDGLKAITAKSRAAATRLVNLDNHFRNNRGWAVIKFLALGPATAGAPVVEDGFNIAMVAEDEEESSFSLPMIIDPPFRNRAT